MFSSKVRQPPGVGSSDDLKGSDIFQRISDIPRIFDQEPYRICEWIRKNPRLTILLVNPKNPYHWVQIKCTVEKELREWEPGGEYVTKQLDRI